MSAALSARDVLACALAVEAGIVSTGDLKDALDDWADGPRPLLDVLDRRLQPWRREQLAAATAGLPPAPAARAPSAGPLRLVAWLGLIALALAGISFGLYEMTEIERVRRAAAAEAQEAKDALDRSDAARTRADAARLRADANLALARKAIDDCFGLARDHPLFQEPRMAPAKKLLVEKTLPFFKDFRPQADLDQRGRADEAEQCHRLAQADLALGDLDAAEKDYRLALTQYGRAIQEGADAPRVRGAKLDVHLELGRLYAARGKRDEATGQFRTAAGLGASLAAAEPGEPAHRLRAGEALDELGNVSLALDRVEEAAGHYAEARKSFGELVTAYPDRPEYLGHLARTRTNWALLLRELGRLDEAGQEYAEALRLRSALVKARPDVPKYREELALTHCHRGDLFAEDDLREDAAKEYRAAVALRSALAEAHPDRPGYRYELARTHGALCGLREAQGKAAESEKEGDAAVALFDALVRDHPERPEYRFEMAHECFQQGISRAKAKKREAAVGRFGQAKTHFLALSREYPGAAEYHSSAARACFERGQLLEEGRPAEALEDYDEGVAAAERIGRVQGKERAAVTLLRFLLPGRAAALDMLKRHEEADREWERAMGVVALADRPNLRLRRAESWAKAGDYLRAAEYAEQEAEGANVAALYVLARVQAMNARHASADAARPLAEREKRAEGYAREAMGLLKRVKATGLFRRLKDAKAVAQDEGLAALRGRADFEAFLATVGD